MSRHQIVRNMDYQAELDEFDAEDDGEEGEQLAPEDREALAKGTEDVREQLGADSGSVTTQQIQEALWYYYYDIEKTVGYLRKKFIDSAQPKAEPKKPKERIAWGKIPDHRQGDLLPPPPSFSGGLLGGSGDGPKMSKLQALAAARKKKAEGDKKPESQPEERTQKRFSRLSISDGASKENAKPGPSILSKRQKLSEENKPAAASTSSTAAISDNMDVDNMASSTPPAADANDAIREVVGETSSLPQSAFAEVLCGPARNSARALPPSLPMPYASSTIFDPAAFEQPSPDDVVLAAQAKATSRFEAAAAKSSKTPVAAKKNTAKMKSGDAPTEGVDSLSLDEAPPPKSKKIDVRAEFAKSENKRGISFVVVGHVDAGKSTLMGRLLLELKFIEQHLIDRYRRQAEKIGKSSFALAWVLDQREEERERGVTIDIATNQFETEKTSFTILDAPGHADFVPNMIAGASQADFAVLVVDADIGAFEKGLKGQTREHALLLRSLGVQRVIVAVNKLDKVGWSQERFNEISEQVTGFMKGNGFVLKNVEFVPISGLNGDNLVKRSEDAALSWYNGPTLIEALEASEPANRALEKPFRMSVGEIYRSQQSQLTVYGRIESGTVQTGESLIVQPSGESAGVRSIEVDAEMHDWAVAGQNVSLGLYGIDPIHIRVGDIISPKSDPIPTSDLLTMKVLAFDHLMPMPVDVHRGRLHAPGRLERLPAILNKATGAIEKKNPKIVQPAKVARVVVKLESKVPLEAGQRIVLRSGGETVAAGLLE